MNVRIQSVIEIPLPEESASVEYDFHARSRSTISGKDPVARQYLNAIVGFFFSDALYCGARVRSVQHPR